jgi:hypothetical protein
MNTTPTMSLAPATNAWAMRLPPMPATRPRAMPMARNIAPMASMSQFRAMMPYTRKQSAARKMPSTAPWRRVQGASTPGLRSTGPRARSSSYTGLRVGFFFTLRA